LGPPIHLDGLGEISEKRQADYALVVAHRLPIFLLLPYDAPQGVRFDLCPECRSYEQRRG
jgi:hypothetical protein